MHGTIAQFAIWLLQKLAVAAFIVLLALAGYGIWLYLQEEDVFEGGRVERLQEAMADRENLLAAKAAIEKRLAAARADIAAQQGRVKKAGEIVATLRQLESWWDRWFGNPEQQSANAAQIQRMEALKSDAIAKVAALERLITQTVWEKEGIELALRRATNEIATVEAKRSRARHYVELAWDKTKWWVALALGSYLAGPTLWALIMYFGVARLFASGRPIRLGPEPAALPEVGESRVSVSATIQPGEILRIKEKFLQASDEGIGRRTRFVLDWRIPFTSLACGLVELVEMRPAPREDASRVTLSNGEDPHLELAIVDVPADASLVLRPSFLAGVMQQEGERLEIRRHWRIFRWQAWISGQFRFFEFVGPCRLIVSGSRGVRAERLEGRAGERSPARRTNQDATIGFTPNLDYLPVRAETFWSYYRGMNPLFDDLFAGRGLFVLQETATAGPGAKAGRFWSSVWNGLLKVFGV